MKALPARIMLVTDSSEVGGAEKVMLQVAERLEQHGVGLISIVPGGGRVDERLRRLGAVVYHLDIEEMKRRWLSRIAWKRMDRRWREILEKTPPDVILANSLWALACVGKIAREKQIPVVCAVHAAVGAKRFLKRLAFPLLQKRIARYAFRWVTVSPRLREDILKLGVPASRVDVIPNGVNLDRFRSVRVIHGGIRGRVFPADSVIIGNVGRLHPGKGQAVLLDVAERLVHRHPETRFVIAGKEFASSLENLGFTEFLESEIRKRDLKRFIHMPGFVENMPGLLNELDIFVSTSREESFGLAVLEAMACGLPVVCGENDGLKHLVENGHQGFLVSPGDVSAYVEKIARLVERESLRKKMGEAARRRAERFDLEVSMQAWLRVFEKPRITPGKKVS